MAAIRLKRPGIWQVVSNTYEDGKRRQPSRSFTSHAEAKAYRAKVELLEQRHIGTTRIALEVYLEEWLVDKKPDIEATTYAGYERWIKHLKRTALAKLAIDRINAEDLERAYRYLSEKPAGRGKPLSPVSIRHCHALLQNVFNDAVRLGKLAVNPALSAKPPRGQSPVRGIPNAMQISALLEDFTTHNPPMADLALLLIGTGMRRSEALGLRFAGIDWAQRTLTVHQVVIEHDGDFSLREGTKSIAGRRTISIDPVILEALRRQQARVAEWRLKLGPAWLDNDLVFPNPASGGPSAPATITRAFTRAAQRAGWPENTSPVHGFRHAAASLSLAGGIDLATVSFRLGHSSPAVTARLYLHGDEARDRKAAVAMSAIPRRQ